MIATASTHPASSSGDSLVISTVPASPSHAVTASGLSAVEKFLAQRPQPPCVVPVDRIRQYAERPRSDRQDLGVRCVVRVNGRDVHVLAVHPAEAVELWADRAPHLRGRALLRRL